MLKQKDKHKPKVSCIFLPKTDTNSWGIRTPILVENGQQFLLKTDTNSC
jgi:hypothetical protein